MKISYYQEISTTGFETDEIILWLHENLEDKTWHIKFIGGRMSSHRDRLVAIENGNRIIDTIFYFEDEESFMGFKLRWL